MLKENQRKTIILNQKVKKVGDAVVFTKTVKYSSMINEHDGKQLSANATTTGRIVRVNGSATMARIQITSGDLRGAKCWAYIDEIK